MRDCDSARMTERRAIIVHGVVQGVGFRPFAYNLATRLGLTGFVRNETGTLHIEIAGSRDQLDRFEVELRGHPPPLAQIARIESRRIDGPTDGEFRILASDSTAGSPIFVSPDVATCTDCLAELLAPNDRRFGYPFLNCTNCGPRLTIITGAPYDRPRTTMTAFAMCPACRAEYDDPFDRRFHAQPTCCPVCGPRLHLWSPPPLWERVMLGGDEGLPLTLTLPHKGGGDQSDSLQTFAEAILASRIGALKGLGGYHLVCDALNETAVAALRRRKHRDDKPFAVMVADASGAEQLCDVSDVERSLLTSPRRPIVLLRRRPDSDIATSVAPGNPFLGVMLPYTPLHHLLLRAVNGRPLVMTSGNRSDEPIAYEDADAFTRLAGIADLFLTHDRPIHVRCDDSVTRVVAAQELPLRRSRGYAPQPVALPFECPRPILAVGGQLKATFALGRGRHAFLSHHLGDLDHFDAFRAFERDVTLYEELFRIRPEVIAHDLHPDYASTGYARRQEQAGVELVAVQHHHAHMASCMAEHGLMQPAIGVSFDGTGYGTDGAVWGGEFLVGNYAGFRRAAHLRYVGLPGGDAAIREPWRMAVAHLRDSGVECPALRARLLPHEYRTIETMLDRGFRTPLTSSAGRLFDAVAALAGVRDRVNYEGQAAAELEWLSTNIAADGVYPFDLADEPLIIDTRPLIRAVAADVGGGTAAAVIGRRFHSTLVALIADVCGRLRHDTGLTVVILSGGVFLNALLTSEVCERLTADGFHVFRHRLVPPNDGGLSLGQLVVAAAQDRGP
jgi:hydrogenase maturation protein HypF